MGRDFNHHHLKRSHIVLNVVGKLENIIFIFGRNNDEFKFSITTRNLVIFFQ